MKRRAATICLLAPVLLAGPFPPPAGQPGSEAIARDDSRIVGWATTVESYQPDAAVTSEWLDSSQALGPAEGNSFEICSLGPQGSITLSFGRNVPNGLGPDLMVFENGFSDSFLELAFVEVSSDGVNFVRFPNRSLTPEPVAAFGGLDTTDVSGLAGKYRQGFGTPFDLADLPVDPNLDRDAVRFVRIVDVEGGVSLDSEGEVIFDPAPTVGSAGFDLDGVALLEADFVANVVCEVVGPDLVLSWPSVDGEDYVILASTTLQEADWVEIATLPATGELTQFTSPTADNVRRFFLVERR